MYNPTKAKKYYIKAYVLTEASSGYIVNYNLVEPFKDKGYDIFMDNYYSGVKLYADLFADATLACGTFRADRKHLLKEQLKRKLRKGEVVFL